MGFFNRKSASEEFADRIRKNRVQAGKTSVQKRASKILGKKDSKKTRPSSISLETRGGKTSGFKINFSKATQQPRTTTRNINVSNQQERSFNPIGNIKESIGNAGPNRSRTPNSVNGRTSSSNDFNPITGAPRKKKKTERDFLGNPKPPGFF